MMAKKSDKRVKDRMTLRLYIEEKEYIVNLAKEEGKDTNQLILDAVMLYDERRKSILRKKDEES